MLAMVKEDNQPQYLSLANLSAPTDVSAMPRLARSSACAPPRMLEAVHGGHEESTASAERYMMWFLGSMRMQSCDTESKVHGGMAFGLRSKTTRVPDEGKVCGGMAFGLRSKTTTVPDDLPMVDARAHMQPPPVPLGQTELLMPSFASCSTPSFTSVIELGDLVAAAELAAEPAVARKGAEVVPEVVP